MFEYLSEMCSAVPLSISVVNFPMNLSIVLIILVQLRQTPGRARPGQIHLLVLAVSDVSIGVFYVVGAVWLRFLPIRDGQI